MMTCLGNPQSRRALLTIIFTTTAGDLKKNLESSDSSTLSLSTIVSSRRHSLRHSFRRSGSMESKKVVLGQVEMSDSSAHSLPSSTVASRMGNSLRNSFRRMGSMQSKKVVLGQQEMSDPPAHSLTSSTVASRMGNSLRNSFRRMGSMESKKGNLGHHRDSFVLIREQNDEFVPRVAYPLLAANDHCCANDQQSMVPRAVDLPQQTHESTWQGASMLVSWQGDEQGDEPLCW
jgi:hypothetical protein